MWYLTSESDRRVLYILSQSTEVTIGRSGDDQNCSFPIADDRSISRKHATLSVTDNNLFVLDLDSKYGTFINNCIEKIKSNLKTKLNDNDVIKFGKLNCVWKVHNINLTTCTSTLKGENFQNVKLCLDKLGGTVKNEWDESCQYLTMPAITLTIKVVLALVQGSHIVKTEFWDACIEAVNNCSALPNPREFTPQILESTLNKENVSFLPDDRRKALFIGKKFIFFSRRQLEMYKSVLVKSSAVALLLSESKMTKSMLCDQDVIVIQYNLVNITQDTQIQRYQINDIVNYLKCKGKRVVADAEIGLAVLYCSTNKYCNPDFNFSSEVIKQSVVQSKKTANILAPETQESIHNVKSEKENIVINESLISKQDDNSSISDTNVDKVVTITKRKLSEDNDIQTNANKKLTIDNSSQIGDKTGSSKRKFTEDDITSLTPVKRVAFDSGEVVGDDMFNFVNPTSTDNNRNVTEKKLNFSKPLKRKSNFTVNEADNDLFNFVENESKTPSGKTSNIFEPNKTKELENSTEGNKNVHDKGNNIDISALRGVKLKELMKSNLNFINESYNVNNIKKEVTDDLGGKMNDLDLGSTTIIKRKDLIVKKEIFGAQNNELKNFKKFKKVWPVNMQVTIIPRSSLSIVKPDEKDISSLTNTN